MGTLCLVSTKFEFIWLEDGISPLGIPRRNAAGRFADQLARRLIAAVGTPLLQEKIGRRRPASCREEGHRARHAPSAEQPQDNAARDQRGAAVRSMI